VDYFCESALSFRVSLNEHLKMPLLNMRKVLTQFGYRTKTFSARNVTEVLQGELEQVAETMTLNDFNRLLFRCDSEERDDGKGFGAFVLDNYGPLKYCGLMGSLV